MVQNSSFKFRMVCISVVTFILIIHHPLTCVAQIADPYFALSDPRGIARILQPLNEPIRETYGVAYTGVIDPSDGYEIVGQDVGSGILTHVWLQLFNIPDSLTDLKIWIDDTLILHSHLIQFFKENHGMLRHPLDTLQSGALDADIQLPYHRNFRITYRADSLNCCLFWGIEWRPVPDSTLTERFSMAPSPTLLKYQANAEAAFSLAAYSPVLSASEGVALDSGILDAAHLAFSPWKNEPSSTTNATLLLPPEVPVEIADIDGPGLIKALHFRPSTFDATTLRNVEMRINWDNASRPSVDVPLADFFGAASRIDTMRSYPIRCSPTEGFISYWPMPFFVHAHIELINHNTTAISTIAQVCYSNESVNRDTLGYFTATFNESNRTRYKVYHHVSNILGSGKFVGAFLSLPVQTQASFLEGNPTIFVDSDTNNFFMYTGSEDYCNGGWFFLDGPVSLPFGGAPVLYQSFYRLHYFDALDFKRSFDFEWQHGVDNDFVADYRTIGVFYLHWCPFWASGDTIRPGQIWTINGTGYLPNSTITGMLGSTAAFAATADRFGTFKTRLSVPQSWIPGNYFLSVNGEVSPNPITVLNRPSISYRIDSLPIAFGMGDSVLIHCSGLFANENITLTIDTITLDSLRIDFPNSLPIRSPQVHVDSSCEIQLWAYIPHSPNGAHELKMAGDRGDTATSVEPLNTTRVFNYEFENLWPPSDIDCSSGLNYTGYLEPRRWSNQNMVYVQPTQAGQHADFRYFLPVDDTFRVQLYATTGARFGNFSVSIDGNLIGSIHPYIAGDFGNILRSPAYEMGIHYFDRGTHVIRFICLGKDSAADEFDLAADNMVLTPTTPFHSSSASGQRIPRTESIDVYPNPNMTGALNLRAQLNYEINSPAPISATLYDILGREIAKVYQGDLTSSNSTIKLALPQVSDGIYFLRIQISSSANTQSIIKSLRIFR